MLISLLPCAMVTSVPGELGVMVSLGALQCSDPTVHSQFQAQDWQLQMIQLHKQVP